MCSVELCFDRTSPFDNQALISQLEIPAYKGPDEIDKWLSENIHVQPGCCSSIESLKYSVAREVAEKLWPMINPELTWQDIAQILTIYEQCVDDGIISRYGDYHSVMGTSVEVLRRFNEQKEEKK